MMNVLAASLGPGSPGLEINGISNGNQNFIQAENLLMYPIYQKNILCACDFCEKMECIRALLKIFVFDCFLNL